jgi:hypothetical protein
VSPLAQQQIDQLIDRRQPPLKVEAAEIRIVVEATIDPGRRKAWNGSSVAAKRSMSARASGPSLPARVAGQSATSPRKTAGSPLGTISRSNVARSIGSYSAIGRMRLG